LRAIDRLALLAAVLAACSLRPTAPDEGTVGPEIRFQWDYAAGDYIRATPLIEGEFVYFGSDDNHVRSLRAATGDLVWDFETTDNVASTPAAHANLLLVTSWDGILYALDAASGQEQSSFGTAGPISASP